MNAAVKFQRYYIESSVDANGERYTPALRARVWYSLDNRADGRKCVTIYERDYYGHLSKILPDVTKNGTDTMTDYFEKDRATLFEDHPLYTAARARAEAKYPQRKNSRYAKEGV